VADGLPLQRLYARFAELDADHASGNTSPTYHRVIERLASNQRHAAAHGWTTFILEQDSDTGRLELRGNSPTGGERQIVPDAGPPDVRAPSGVEDRR
jgi:hypothetical protein